MPPNPRRVCRCHSRPTAQGVLRSCENSASRQVLGRPIALSRTRESLPGARSPFSLYCCRLVCHCVLLCCCTAAPLYCCSRVCYCVLVCCCTAVLVCYCVLMCCCATVCSFLTVLLQAVCVTVCYCCTSVLLHQCTVVGWFAAVSLSCLIALVFWPISQPC